eukprot:CAMPEP_0196653128 /NCGR_PEP_ID=MMETSP1086-20130531/2725_1 /TAXON_ID=77921 /ORGANISM="Cyanoptyche  gloeocystis , Strain SAG4.97" /LENGTH=103 /DNA_ID=CAMNT_0041984159 /DNA_START=81 /DNA_END=392 /DNA_ORIENTATION=+
MAQRQRAHELSECIIGEISLQFVDSRLHSLVLGTRANVSRSWVPPETIRDELLPPTPQWRDQSHNGVAVLVCGLHLPSVNISVMLSGFTEASIKVESSVDLDD